MDTLEFSLNQIFSPWDHVEIFLNCVPVSRQRERAKQAITKREGLIYYGEALL